MGLNICYLNITATTVFDTKTTPPKLDTIMFENWQRINPMGLSAPSDDYKNKQLYRNMNI